MSGPLKADMSPSAEDLERDLIDRLARAVDPEAFSPLVRSYFVRASLLGRPTRETAEWMPRIIKARQAASRVMDVLKPTEFMLQAAEALLDTHPCATPKDLFDMMIFAERDAALRKLSPGIVLADVSPEEYLDPIGSTFG